MNGYYLKGINFVYNTNKYTQKKEMLWKSISSLYKMEYIKEHNTDQLTEISEKGNLLDDVNFQQNQYWMQAKKIQLEIAEMENAFKLDDTTDMIGKAYIFFSRGEHRDQCYERYKRTGFTYSCFGFGENTDDQLFIDVMGKQKQVFFDRPQEPADVIWENLKYSNESKFIRRQLSTIISFVIISFGFISLYYLKTNQTIKAVKLNYSLRRIGMEQFTAILVSVIIVLISILLKVTIKLLSKWQKPGSTTELHLAIAKGLWKMQFINMAIVPFLISASMLNFFDLGGLIEELNLIFILNMILPHLINLLLDFEYFFILFQQFRLAKFLRTGRWGVFNQKQANEIVEGLDFDIYVPYSYVFSTVASALFYLPIFPMGLVYAVVSLVFQYWTTKVSYFL